MLISSATNLVFLFIGFFIIDIVQFVHIVDSVSDSVKNRLKESSQNSNSEEEVHTHRRYKRYDNPRIYDPPDSVLLRLQLFPNYSTKLNLRNVKQFPCIFTPGTNCTVVLVPPVNHGLIVSVKKLNIRINIRPQSIEYYEDRNGVVKPKCRDYLLVNTNSSSSLSLLKNEHKTKVCGGFSARENDGKNITVVSSTTTSTTTSQPPTWSSAARLYIGKAKQFTSSINQSVTLMLHHDTNEAYDDEDFNKWDLNDQLGGEIIVTSYIDCSSSDPIPNDYKECSAWFSQLPPSHPKQCVLVNLFCDGNNNCNYNEAKEDFGVDETNCPVFETDEPPPIQSVPSWYLLPTKPTRPTTTRRTTPRTTPTTTRRSRIHQISNTPSTGRTTTDDGIPVLTYNDLRKSSSSSSAINTPWYRTLSAGFVITAFIIVIALTICFGFIVKTAKLPETSYSYGTGRARDWNTYPSLDPSLVEANLRVLSAPPPTYPEVSELPSYDSLFKGPAQTDIDNAAASNSEANSNNSNSTTNEIIITR